MPACLNRDKCTQKLFAPRECTWGRMWASQAEAQHLFPVQAEEASAAEGHATAAARRAKVEQSLQAALGQSAVAGEHAQADSQSVKFHNDILLQQLPNANGQRAWACICRATADLTPDSCRHVSAGKAFCPAAGSISSKKVRLQGLIDVRCRRRVEVAQRAERIRSDGSAGSAHICAAGGALWGQPGPQAGSRAGKGHRSRWCAPLNLSSHEPL